MHPVSVSMPHVPDPKRSRKIRDTLNNLILKVSLHANRMHTPDSSVLHHQRAVAHPLRCVRCAVAPELADERRPALLPDRGHGAHSPALPFDSLVPFHHTRRSRFGTPLFAQVVEWDECAALPRCARSCTSMIAWLAHLRFLQTLLVRRVRFDVRLMQRVPYEGVSRMRALTAS